MFTPITGGGRIYAAHDSPALEATMEEQHQRAWQLLAELVRRTDGGEQKTVTAATSAATMGADRSEAEQLLNMLRRRGLVETNERAPQRMGDGIVDRPLLVAPEGFRVAAAGSLDR